MKFGFKPVLDAQASEFEKILGVTKNIFEILNLKG